MDSISLIGYVAGIGTTISFIPQVVHIVRTRSVNDLSPYMFMIHSTGVVSWIIYGALLRNPIIVVFNAITFSLNLIILAYFIRQWLPLYCWMPGSPTVP